MNYFKDIFYTVYQTVHIRAATRIGISTEADPAAGTIWSVNGVTSDELKRGSFPGEKQIRL